CSHRSGEGTTTEARGSASQGARHAAGSRPNRSLTMTYTMADIHHMREVVAAEAISYGEIAWIQGHYEDLNLAPRDEAEGGFVTLDEMLDALVGALRQAPRLSQG